MAKQTKDEIYFAVCNAILKLELEKGHLKWTFAEVARHSKITRTLIYYYFGKNKDVVLQEAYRFIIDRFFVSRAINGSLADRMCRVVKDIQSMPYLYILYFLQKNGKTDFAKMITEGEKLLLKSFAAEFPNLDEDQILSIYLKELGAITYHLDESRIRKIFAKP
jgi:AcrR family transcriptional regulator